jgi:hypothetical protein
MCVTVDPVHTYNEYLVLLMKSGMIDPLWTEEPRRQPPVRTITRALSPAKHAAMNLHR